MKGTPRALARRATARPRRSVKIFISYSHQNKVWIERLTPLLDGFQYDERLTKNGDGLECVHAWHDHELTPGNPWDEEIKKELEEMDVFVPLVGAHFFASWYIQNVELPTARKRYTKDKISVVPILLYDVNLRERCSFLHAFPAFPTSSEWWSKYPDPNDAHRRIDDGLWGAIEAALRRRPRRSP